MNENKDGDNKVTLNIPGVIIPEQQTENGTIIESVDKTKSEPAPNVEVPQQPTTTVENQTSQAQAIPEIPDQAGVANGVPTAPPAFPDMNNVPDFEEDSNTNKKKPKKAPKQPKGSSNPTLVFIIIILLGAVGYLVYDNYLKPKEKIDPVKELERKRSLNKDSLVVQDLFNYINLDGCKEQIDFFYGDKNPVKLADLTEENKNYLAYRNLKHSDFAEKNCNNYPRALNKNDEVKLWYCGDYNKKNTEETTNIINESAIETQVNKIFGEGSYKPKTFAIASSARYLYDDNTSSYIYQSFDGKNSCNGYTNILENVYRKGDYIMLAVKVENKQTHKLQMFYYTFQESDNGNYYFVSLSKKDA